MTYVICTVYTTLMLLDGQHIRPVKTSASELLGIVVSVSWRGKAQSAMFI